MIDQPSHRIIDRQVWHFHSFREHSNMSIGAIETEGAHQVAERVTSTILRVAKLHIPYGKMWEHKSTHPWITPRCEAAVKRK